MQSRLSPSHLPEQFNGLAPVSRSAAQGNQPAFQGTIASACDLGIRIDNFITMTRLMRTSDLRVARFLDAWEALGSSEQQARGAAISGHVSRRMIEHYSHIRMDAKRRATDAIVERDVNQNVNQRSAEEANLIVKSLN